MIPTIAFFNNSGGTDKTSLVYHLAWMYADMGYTVLAADLDPLATLTAAMVEPERLGVLWNEGRSKTLYGAVSPFLLGLGDISDPHRERIGDKLELIVGDLGISRFQDELAAQWARCMDRQERALRIITVFHRCIQAAARAGGADVVLIDLSPYLDAISRAALLASEYIVIPVAPDLFSLQGLRSFGPMIKQWREEWEGLLDRNSAANPELEKQVMRPAGYVVWQHSVRLNRPVQAFDLGLDQIPDAYAEHVLGEPRLGKLISEDPHCLGVLKPYGSLMPMAQEARKPVFHLKPADGALGAHATAARGARGDFKRVAERISQATWQPKPQH